MSFILDALKKSESDRQGRNVPDSAHVPMGSVESSSSRWLWIIGALLLANVLVLAFFLLKPDATGGESNIVVDTGTTAKEAASFRDIVSTVRRNPPQPEPASPANEQSTDPISIDTVTPPETAAVETRSIASHSSTVVRTFNDVRLDGSIQLPDLHIDLHVFSGTRAERFVFINMNKYKENETLSEGPVVSEIVAEGVILEYLNTRFLLPRE